MDLLDDMNKIKQYLKKWNISDIFDDQSIAVMKLMAYKPEEYVLTEGEPVDYIYLLLDGKAKIVPTSTEGQIALIDFISPIDVVGDLEYFSHDTYYHSIVTTSKCLFLAIPTDAIPKLFDDNVLFYKLLCTSLASKMKRTSIQYSNALLYPLKNRIAKYLLDIREDEGQENVKLSFKLTAEYFGITPRHFRRILKEFEEEGAIERKKTSIDLIDVNVLNKYANAK